MLEEGPCAEMLYTTMQLNKTQLNKTVTVVLHLAIK